MNKVVIENREPGSGFGRDDGDIRHHKSFPEFLDEINATAKTADEARTKAARYQGKPQSPSFLDGFLLSSLQSESLVGSIAEHCLKVPNPAPGTSATFPAIGTLEDKCERRNQASPLAMQPGRRKRSSMDMLLSNLREECLESAELPPPSSTVSSATLKECDGKVDDREVGESSSQQDEGSLVVEFPRDRDEVDSKGDQGPSAGESQSHCRQPYQQRSSMDMLLSKLKLDDESSVGSSSFYLSGNRGPVRRAVSVDMVSVGREGMAASAAFASLPARRTASMNMITGGSRTQGKPILHRRSSITTVLSRLADNLEGEAAPSSAILTEALESTEEEDGRRLSTGVFDCNMEEVHLFDNDSRFDVVDGMITFVETADTGSHPSPKPRAISVAVGRDTMMRRHAEPHSAKRF